MLGMTEFPTAEHQVRSDTFIVLAFKINYQFKNCVEVGNKTRYHGLHQKCPGTFMDKQRKPNYASVYVQFLKLAYEVRLREVSAQIPSKQLMFFS